MKYSYIFKVLHISNDIIYFFKLHLSPCTEIYNFIGSSEILFHIKGIDYWNKKISDQ